MDTFVLVVTFIVTLLLGFPIAFVIGLSGVSFFLMNPDIPYSIVAQRIVAQTQSVTFLAVPFFILAGHLMNFSGITKKLLSFSELFTRRSHGGLAKVNILLSTLMGGISGSAVSDASMEARILGPRMIDKGYSRGYTAAVTCISSLITATIPPSLGLILYGYIGQVSIGRLLLAGIVPGILMCLTLLLVVEITSRKNGYEPPEPDATRLTKSELWNGMKDAVWALLFPIILIVGIRFGLFMPSEAGAFAVVYAIVIGSLVYKELTWEKFKKSLILAGKDSGVILMIIALSGILSYCITLRQIPAHLSEMILGMTDNPQMMQLIIMLFLFLIGMILDSDVITVLLTPIFVPIIKQLGIDPVHFGVMMATIITLGIMTPPVGTAFYIVCGILETPIEEYVKEYIPFIIAVLILFSVLIFFPDVVLFLPNLVYGGGIS